MNTLTRISLVLCLALMPLSAGAATTTLVSDDLSDLDGFTNVTHAGTVDWTSNGTDATYNHNSGGGGDRASLRGDQTFDFNPAGRAYQSVTLEFTTSISDAGTSGVNRLEVALIDATTIGSYDNPLAFESGVRGAGVNHTPQYNPAGLVFSFGSQRGTGASDVPMTPTAGTHTYKIVFDSTGAELFRDNVSQGTTAQVLDFTRNYRIVAFAQDDTSTRSFDNVLLSAEGLYYQLALAPDAANSDTAEFGSSIEATLTDPFAHDSTTPISPSPNLTYAGSTGFHGSVPTAQTVDIAYTLVNGDTTLTAQELLVIDLYGRGDCCGNRDDDFDVNLYDGGVLVASATGLAIDGDSHLQIDSDDFDVSLTGLTFDALRISARDSNGAGDNNFFTLQEIRVNVFAIPAPAALPAGLLMIGALAARRRRRK